MGMLEAIDDMFEKISDSSDCSKDLVTLATALGALVIFICTICVIYKLQQVLRLYFCSQFCCQRDFVERYGKWAVISGSTDGIGQSMAKELARRGMSILVIGRNDEKLANTKAMLEKVPNVGDVETIKIDLSDSSIENFDRIRSQIDPERRDIGILINNAGWFPAKFVRFNHSEMSSLINIVNLNILAPLHLTRMIMPGMVERGKGLVVNVSSALGVIPTPYMSVYGATKSFIDSFTRQLQMEYASHPLDIVLLTPGGVFTKLMTATATQTKPWFLVPSPDDYARSSLNAISTGISIFSGTLTHGISRELCKVSDCLGMLPMLSKLNLYLNVKAYELSPVPKRKRVQTGDDTAMTATATMENIDLNGGESRWRATGDSR